MGNINDRLMYVRYGSIRRISFNCLCAKKGSPNLKEVAMNKRSVIFCLSVLFVFLSGMVFAQEDIKSHPSCKYCGMDRAKFAHSRVLINYDDGTTVGTCSIHCAAVDSALNIDKTPTATRVGDYGTKTLVDVEKAFWVLGGNKMGVMTKRAKWAFGLKEDAEKFTKENGGQIVSYEQVITAAYEDMQQDTKMIRDRRKLKRMEKK